VKRDRRLSFSFIDLKKVFKDVYNYKSGNLKWVSIGGGEPLKVTWLLDLIKYLKDLGVNILLTTNGTLVTRKVAEILFAAGLTRVQVSLDGVCQETHDKIRGKGTFEKAIRAIHFFQDSGIEVTLRMTLTSYNFHEVEDFVKVGKELGVISVSCRKLIPVGRGLANQNMLDIPIPVYRNILQKLPGLEEKYQIRVSSGDPLAIVANQKLLKHIDQEWGLDNVITGCTPGISYLYISPDGFVKPCPMIDVKLGDLKTASIWEIWETANFYNRIRNRSSSKCVACRYRFVCGGCRAAAYANCGDYFGIDPNCWF